MSQEIFIDGAYHVLSSGARKLVAFNMGDRVRISTNPNGVPMVQRMGQIQHLRITLAAESVTVVDAGANGAHAGHKLLTFPEGQILILAAKTDLAILAGAGGIADDAAVVAALGTVATTTANDALTTTEADIIASTAALLASGAGNFDAATIAAGIALDGTAGAKSIFLNFAIPGADSSANDTLAVTGTIDLFWLLLGDD